MLGGSGLFVILTASFADLKNRFMTKYFPSSIEIDIERYLSVQDNMDLLSSSGFRRVKSEGIVLGSFNVPENILFYRKRKSSILKLIDDEEYAKGMEEINDRLSSSLRFDKELHVRPWNRTLIVAEKSEFG